MKIKHFFAILPVLAGATAHAGDFRWEGFYVGLEAGLVNFKPDWKTTGTFAPNGAPYTGLSSELNPSMSGSTGVYSLVGGYNWKIAPTWVIGVEANLGMANYKKTLDFIPGLNPTPGPDLATTTVEAKEHEALQFRAEYLITPRTAVYGTLGCSFQKIKVEGSSTNDTHITNPAAGTITYGNSKSVKGIAIGIGAEQAFANHWIARVGYTYAQYSKTDVSPMRWSINSFGETAEIKPTAQFITLGVTYKF